MPDTMQQWVAAMRADRFDAAWAIAERTLSARDPSTRDDPSLPYHLRWVWDGGTFDGRHVLVRCYHGLGDTIQFARYLAPLARRAASVTVEVQPQLVALLAQIPGLALMPFDPAHPLAPGECDIEIMELAFALRLRPGEVAAPYLTAPADPRGASGIGLCCTTGSWDVERRIPADLLRTICRDYRCVSLMPEPSTLPVINPDGCSADVEATAAVIASLALVITVDTMVAHLAGALGVPAWMLLKAEPDWRWSAGRTSSWYPTARLYRQRQAGAWAPVIAEVERDLSSARGAVGSARHHILSGEAYPVSSRYPLPPSVLTAPSQ